MSIMDSSVPGTGTKYPALAPPTPDGHQPLHRLAVVRRQQRVSRRAVAKKLNVDVNTVKLLEDETSDMLLSTLYEWQNVLDVPVSELLVEPERPLSAPVMKRAQLVRLMKTVLAILERCQQASVRRMAQTMVEQLIEIMPELEGVSPWHAVGQRRTLNELGQAAERCISPDVFRDVKDAWE